MLANDKSAVGDLDSELRDTRQLLESEDDLESSRFIKVLQVGGATHTSESAPACLAPELGCSTLLARQSSSSRLWHNIRLASWIIGTSSASSCVIYD